MPTQSFALDVCYKSDVSTLFTPNQNNPIAMADGFVNSTNGLSEVGAIIDLSVNAGDQIRFTFLDIADSAVAAANTIASMVIQCDDVTPPRNTHNPIRGGNPFGWPAGTYVVPAADLANRTSFGSTGCNMNGFGNTIGPFTAQAANGQGRGQIKTYELTITITLTNGRVFQVDPEVDVQSVD
ncbi:MAG: hypothetical protein SF097_27200 [Acidobacteriota bacterium]|nr:hypothetical protein [Acidobacteriota bacterium]